METQDARSVLITGGGKGIGLGLAARFLARGDRVLVTGRSTDTLRRAAERLPGLEVVVSDISNMADRERLAEHVRQRMPAVDVVVNNAGIQRRVSLASDSADWTDRQIEIDTLLAGPIHLNHLLIPIVLAHGRPSVIVNVTSGGALIPQPFAPVYSACKAALHSYTVNLRFALAATSCRVTELIPLAVATTIAEPAPSHGAQLDEFCDAVFPMLDVGPAEIGYGMTDTPVIRQRLADERAVFDEFATRFPVRSYG
jgi:uncharacterized oxidoreductase